jgi:hypothetical protein
MSDLSAASIGRLTSRGVEVISTDAAYRTVTADVTPGALGAVANDPDVSYVAEVLAPHVGSGATGSTGLGGVTGRMAGADSVDARPAAWTSTGVISGTGAGVSCAGGGTGAVQAATRDRQLNHRPAHFTQ